MESGTRMGSRSSTRYGPASVFTGPVRKWKKRWIPIPSSSSTSSGPSSSQSSKLSLYRWSSLSNGGGKDDTADDPSPPPPRRIRYVPLQISRNCAIWGRSMVLVFGSRVSRMLWPWFHTVHDSGVHCGWGLDGSCKCNTGNTYGVSVIEEQKKEAAGKADEEGQGTETAVLPNEDSNNVEISMAEAVEPASVDKETVQLNP